MEQSGQASATSTRLSSRTAQPAFDLEECVERLLPRLRVAVIFGGSKSTPGSVIYPSGNTRSWKSYEAVATDIAESLSRIGFRHVCLMPDDMFLGERLRRDGIHMGWLNTSGVQGRNPACHAPAMLEMFGVPYVGHDSLAATTLDNKHAFKREAVCAGLPTTPFVTWHMARGPFKPEINSRFQRAFGAYPGPFVVKPVSGRASLHVHFVDRRAELPDAVAEVYRATENVVLIEKYLSGREFCIAVAGPITSRSRRLVRGTAPFTFAALERVLSEDERIFTSMDVRPITAERCRPLDANMGSDWRQKLHAIACEVFLEFNLASLIRLDLRADEAGTLFILEANPKPDLKRPTQGVTSLIAAGLRETDMDYDDLILSLFADRLDLLLSYRRKDVQHIIELIGCDVHAGEDRSSARVASSARPDSATEAYLASADLAAAAAHNQARVELIAAEAGEMAADRDVVAAINEAATAANVELLDGLRRAPTAHKQRKLGS